MHYERKLARKIPKHPSLDIVGSDGAELTGKKIVLCIAGSVAAYKSIELARLLMRHGASVTCVASDAATKLIQPAYFKWATGNPVITKLTGNLEHIAVADYKKSDFVSPNMIEGKAKAAEPEDVLEHVLKKFGFSSVLHGKKVLITAGPTIEYLDPVRVITNQSTGRTGVLLASELISAGAKVTMVYGPGREKP